MTRASGFSVVVTSYNYREFIGDALDSALGQTHPPEEIIVVDDGSTDGTGDHLRARYGADARVRLIEQANAGQLAAFITGTRAAQAGIVAYLDADDVWEPTYLERVAAVYAQRPVDYVYTNMRFFGERDGTYLDEHESRDLGLSILLGSYRPAWQSSATSAISLKREFARRVFDLPDSFLAQWRSRADDFLAFGSNILGARKFYLAEPLVRYRAHGANVWLNRELGPDVKLRHWLAIEGMLSWYRTRMGMDAALRGEHLRMAKHEFRTKQRPTRKELRVYVELLWQSSLSWRQKVEHEVSLHRHYWRTRGKTPVSQPLPPALDECPVK